MIEWLPLADMPEALKDGREVLLWDGSVWLGRYMDGGFSICPENLWTPVDATHFAEINRPETIERTGERGYRVERGEVK